MSTPGRTPLPASATGWPCWAHGRAAKLAQIWGSGRLLLAYPRTRAFFVLPFLMLGVVWGSSVLVPLVLVPAVQDTAVTLIGIGLFALVYVVNAVVTLAAIAAWRMSIVVTTRGIEVRQLPLRTHRVRWDEVRRVEAQQTGYRAGASVLVLTSGERIICSATDPRRAIYNGYRLRQFMSSDSHFASPTTTELISIHRAWLAGDLPH